MLNIVFGLEPPSGTDSFGVLLTPDTIDRQIERIRNERDIYQATHGRGVKGKPVSSRTSGGSRAHTPDKETLSP